MKYTVLGLHFMIFSFGIIYVPNRLLTIRGQSYSSMNFEWLWKVGAIFLSSSFFYTIFPVKKANFKFDMYTNLFGFGIF